MEDPTFHAPNAQKFAQRQLLNDDSGSDESNSDAEIQDQLNGKTPEEILQIFLARFREKGLGDEPKVHELGRQRTTRYLTSIGKGFAEGKHRNGHAKADSKLTMTAADRVEQFPNEGLEDRLNDLWCSYCNTALSLRGTKQHIDTKKHIERKQAKTAKIAPASLQSRMHSYIQDQRLDRSTTIPVTTQTHRMSVCYALLLDGVSFHAILHNPHEYGLRRLLEENKGTLPYRETADMIPEVESIEKSDLIKEIGEAAGICIIFDCTPHVAEVFGIVIRFVLTDKITHRLLALRFYDKLFSQAQLAAALLRLLMVEYNIPPDNIRCAVCDGCKVNHAAMNLLKSLYPKTLEIVCISHSANNVGVIQKNNSHGMNLEHAKKFEELWSYIMNVSPRARAHFRNAAQTEPMRSSEVRWFCWWEILNQVYEKSAAVREVVFHEEEFCEQSREGLRELLAPQNVKKTRLELAFIIDIGELLVKLCYHSEQDDILLCAVVYDHWTAVANRIQLIADQSTPVGQLEELLPKTSQNARDISYVRGEARPDDAVKVVRAYATQCKILSDKMMPPAHQPSLLPHLWLPATVLREPQRADHRGPGCLDHQRRVRSEGCPHLLPQALLESWAQGRCCHACLINPTQASRLSEDQCWDWGNLQCD